MNINPEIKVHEDDNGKIYKVDYTLLIQGRQKGDSFLARCSVLNAIGFSEKNQIAAFGDLTDNLDLFFKIHAERGTLKTALVALGWKKRNDNSNYISDVLVRSLFEEKKYSGSVEVKQAA